MYLWWSLCTFYLHTITLWWSLCTFYLHTITLLVNCIVCTTTYILEDFLGAVGRLDEGGVVVEGQVLCLLQDLTLLLRQTVWLLSCAVNFAIIFISQSSNHIH